MSVFALVKAGIVVNRIVVEGDYTPEAETEMVEDDADLLQIGGAYAGGVYTPLPPPDPPPTSAPPTKTLVSVGLVRFTVTAGVLTSTTDTIGIDSVTRVSAGRYRIYYSDPDNQLMVLPAPIIRDAADVRCRISSKTPGYTEIKAVNASGTAVDVAEVTVMMSKVV